MDSKYTYSCLYRFNDSRLVERKSILQWLVTERECRTSKKKLGLAKETIYQLKVRESLPYINPYNQKEMEKGKWLKVEEVVKRKLS